MLSETCITVQVPWGIDGFAGFEPFLLVIFVMALAAVASTFVRWRRSDEVERHQIKWFFVAAIALLAAFVISFLDFDTTLNKVVFALALTAVWASIAILFGANGMAAGIGVAVTRHRLYGIDKIVSRTVTYTVLVVLLALAFFGLVTGLTTFVTSDEPLVVAIATLAVAALFNPLRNRLLVWVNRRFHRSTYQAEIVVADFTNQLRDNVDPEALAGGWVDVVEETMQPSAVGVWVRG